MALVKRGDVFLVDLNPIKGSEIGKERPAIIISNNLNNKHADTVTLIPITKGNLERVYPFEVLLKKKTGGLKFDSKAKTSQIRTVDKSRLTKKLGAFKAEIIKKIERALFIHLGILGQI